MKKTALIIISLLLALTSFAGEKSLLDNGVKFIEIHRDFTDTVSVVAFVRGGKTRETAENSGVGSLFTSSWVKSSELLKTSEFYGAGIGASVSADFVEITFSMASEHFDSLIDAYSEFIKNPVIDEAVFEHDKNLQKEAIKASEDSPDSKAFSGFMEATYGGHPYGLSAEGTLETVEKLTIKDLNVYASEILQGANITVAVAGKYSPEQLNRIKEIFGSLPKGEIFQAECAGSSMAKASETVEKGEKLQQAKLFVGYTAPRASDKEYAALKVITDILGGGMSSRYFNTLRKDKGYAYSVGAAYPSRICSSRFVAHIGLSKENIPDAIETIDRINREFVNDLTEKEMESVKNYMLGRLLIDSQTNSKQAWYACFFENAGLGSDYFDNYINVLRGITLADIRKAAEIFKGEKTVYMLK